MTGLWTNDRDTLADLVEVCGDFTNPWDVADSLIDKGVVRMLDPDDTELVDQVRDRMWDEGIGITRLTVRKVIEALRQP
jgi:hypothetical protein